MIIYTHIVFAIASSMILIKFGSIEFNILGIFVCIFGALLPDIDSKRSLIGKFFNPIPHITKHRGFLHTIYFTILISLLFYFTFGLYYFQMFMVGILSHLFLDSLNYKGIKPFYPIHGFRIKGFIKTGGVLEFILLGIFISTIGIITLW